MNFPGFDAQLASLNRFINRLVKEYQSGDIKSWDELEKKVKIHFTPERMDQMESRVPGWQKMASYSGGITLVHVMCVFLGLFELPEFVHMTKEQQQIMKWTVLFHDLEKEPPQGKRDHMHAFRSAAAAARILPGLGFVVKPEYDLLINEWDRYTRSAMTISKDAQEIIQENHKLPEILAGIDRMFGRNTPPALIVKTILFHLSVNMNAWPPAAPLTDAEVAMYFDPELALLLKAMNLADGEGWNMFGPNRELLRNDTVESFKKVEYLISRP